jgi:hypothetical protein
VGRQANTNLRKEEKKEISKKEMTVAEIKATFNIDLIQLQKEYYATIHASLRGKPVKNETVLVVWFNDITITEADGIITSTVSPDAQWAGIQKFLSTTSNDGAIGIWESNRYYYTPPGPGTITFCHYVGPGYYRGFSSDFNANVHITEFKFIP